MTYLEYLPEIFRKGRAFRRIGEGLWPDVEAFCAAAEALPMECAAETASEEGIRRFERMLGVHPEAGEALSERRARARGILTGTPPFSMGWLRQRLRREFGGGAFAEEFPKEHRLRVGAEAGEGSLLALRQELREKIPANMELQMSSLHRGENRIFTGALVQMGAVHKMEVRINGGI